MVPANSRYDAGKTIVKKNGRLEEPPILDINGCTEIIFVLFFILFYITITIHVVMIDSCLSDTHKLLVESEVVNVAKI